MLEMHQGQVIQPIRYYYLPYNDGGKFISYKNENTLVVRRISQERGDEQLLLGINSIDTANPEATIKKDSYEFKPSSPIPNVHQSGNITSFINSQEISFDIEAQDLNADFLAAKLDNNFTLFSLILEIKESRQHPIELPFDMRVLEEARKATEIEGFKSDLHRSQMSEQQRAQEAEMAQMSAGQLRALVMRQKRGLQSQIHAMGQQNSAQSDLESQLQSLQAELSTISQQLNYEQLVSSGAQGENRALRDIFSNQEKKKEDKKIKLGN